MTTCNVIRRIKVAMRSIADEKSRATVDRVYGFYAMNCPLDRTLRSTTGLSSTVEIVGN
jgi:hypothetical protein